MNSEYADPELRENDLYPPLATFMREQQAIQTYRIDERKSSNLSGVSHSRWLCPNAVGIENRTENTFAKEMEAISGARDRQVRVWSFDAELFIDRSNVREAYHRALSNSSWANYGYIVTAGIEGPGILKELRDLCAMHGIGLIKLDASSVAESRILVPALERREIDWWMCNRLVEENSDFTSFMVHLRNCFRASES